MDDAVVRSLSSGLSQKGVRNHNERLVLSLLQRHGTLPGSDLARLAGLSPPTVSAILRSLEADGLLARGTPVKGKVGKPSIPMHLASDGVLSYGLKIGRRSAELILMDFNGRARAEHRTTYPHPLPSELFHFVEAALAETTATLTAQEQGRICGIGVAAPFELWSWRPQIGVARGEFDAWQNVNFAQEVRAFSSLPVSIMNDATAACQAEHVYGRGKEFRDYAYFFVGAFIGGGVVLNHSVYEGRQGNAGALGSLRSIGPNGESKQLIDMASIHLLEARLGEVGLDPQQLWQNPQDWSHLSRYVEPWLGQTAQELAKACLSTCSVIDFEAVLVDGAFPDAVRLELVERIRRYLATQDTRGLLAPQVEAGTIGATARAMGAASSPIFSQYLLNTHAGLSVA